MTTKFKGVAYKRAITTGLPFCVYRTINEAYSEWYFESAQPTPDNLKASAVHNLCVVEIEISDCTPSLEKVEEFFDPNYVPPEGE